MSTLFEDICKKTDFTSNTQKVVLENTFSEKSRSLRLVSVP